MPTALKLLTSASTQHSKPPRALPRGYRSSTETSAATDKSLTRNNRVVTEPCQTLWRGRRFLWKHHHGTWEVLVQLSLPRLF